MNILVTGAKGFLGLNLVKKLISQSFTVFAITKTPIDFVHPNFHVIQCDLNDINKVQGLKIDIVFHTAARINFDESYMSLSQLTRDNIISTYLLADFILKNNIKKVIHSSSCSVYEENYYIDNWISEGHRLRPRNTYAVSKLASDWILENKLMSSVVELIILRYSSIYGYGQRKDSILPIFIENASNNADLNIIGSGERIQDYVYIDDVVDANLKCIDKKLPFNTILNIGSGEQITDLMLAQNIKNIWKSNSKINILNESNEPETYLNYDIKNAKRLIGYMPLSLYEGLELYKNPC